MAYNPEEDIKVSDLPEKTTDVVSDDKLLVIDSEDANILKQVDASKVGGGGTGYTKAETDALLNAKQDTLESGTNIKTINGNSILGPGNIEIQGGSGTVDTEMSDTSTNAVQNKVIKAYVDSQGGGDETLKLFYLDDINNYTTATEVRNWTGGGNLPTTKNCVISYNNNLYYYSRGPSGSKFFKTMSKTSDSIPVDYVEVLKLSYNLTERRAEFTVETAENTYLNTSTDYSTPYTPLYDGSPATKKYVDDAVAGGGDGVKVFKLSKRYYTSSNNTSTAYLSEEDKQVFNDAIAYANAGGNPILKNGNYFCYLRGERFYEVPLDVKDYVLVEHYLTNTRAWNNGIENLSGLSGYMKGSINIENYQNTSEDQDIDIGTLGRGGDYMIKGVFVFDINIKSSGGADVKRYSLQTFGDFNEGTTTKRYITSSGENRRMESGSYVFDLNTTERGRLVIRYLSNGVGNKTLRISQKNKTHASNTLSLDYMIFAM